MASVLKKKLQKIMSKLYVNKKRNRELYKINKKKVRKKSYRFCIQYFFLLDIHGISCRDIQHIVGTKYSVREEHLLQVKNKLDFNFLISLK